MPALFCIAVSCFLPQAPCTSKTLSAPSCCTALPALPPEIAWAAAQTLPDLASVTCQLDSVQKAPLAALQWLRMGSSLFAGKLEVLEQLLGLLGPALRLCQMPLGPLVAARGLRQMALGLSVLHLERWDD